MITRSGASWPSRRHVICLWRFSPTDLASAPECESRLLVGLAALPMIPKSVLRRPLVSFGPSQVVALSGILAKAETQQETGASCNIK